ncbi:MAG: type II toxin-antitoxin system VapB family antitoxin [Deltaproteobacteria bacterium]|nr:type II toxin-antitoxin system VapB family antitoxin [Deltaproteobacteria bacterium]
MRTTIAIDDDLLEILKAQAESEHRSLKDAVNDALRAGLVHLRAQKKDRPHIVIVPFSRGRPRFPDLESTGEMLSLMDEDSA